MRRFEDRHGPASPNPEPPSPSERSPRSTALTLLLIAAAVIGIRLGMFLLYTPADAYTALGTDSWLQTARNLVDGHGYVAPYPGMPTAVRGPIPVFYFAFLLTLFGEGFWPIVLSQTGLDVLTSIALFFLALEIFSDRRVATVAGLFYAFYGPAAFLCLNAWSEPLFALILSLLMLTFLKTLRRPNLWGFVIVGVLCGIGTLTRPVLQLFPFVLCALVLWRARSQWRRAMINSAAICVAFSLVLLPWVVRNALIFSAFIPASSLSGMANYQSHYFLAEDDYLRYRTAAETRVAFREFIETRMGPLEDPPPEFSRFLQGYGLDEHEVSSLAHEEAVNAIREYPLRYVALTFLRALRLWFNLGLEKNPSLESWLVAAINALLLGLGSLAFLFARGRWVAKTLPLFVLLVYHTSVHMALFAIGRYNAPIAPYVILFASQGVVSLGQRFLHNRPVVSPAQSGPSVQQSA